MKRTLSIVALLAVTGCAEAPLPPYPTHPPHCSQPMAFFAPGSATLTERNREMLAGLIKTRLPGQVCVFDPTPTNRYRVYVTGHTDKAGSEARNQQLGMQRAQSVASYLIELGVAREYICVRTAGSANLLVIRGPANEPQNRRVEIHFDWRRTQEEGCRAGAVPPSP